MKTLKKVLAWVMTLAMVFCMSGLTAFAADSKKPVETDVAKITVKDVEENSIVKAYQIVKANYNGQGFVGYERASGIAETDLVDPLNPTSEEVNKLAATLAANGANAIELTYGNSEYSAEVAVGYWIVVVSQASGKTAYNPMLLGVYYDKDGSGTSNVLKNGEISAKDHWTLNGTTAYPKSDTPSIDKKIMSTEVGTDGDDFYAASKDGKKVGDKVPFQIKINMPSYTEQYNNDKLKVEVTDTLSKGLTFNNDIAVTIGGKDAVVDTDYSIIPTTKKTFGVFFSKDTIMKSAGMPVVITYSATLNSDAKVNFDANTNKAELEYSTDPSGTTEKAEHWNYIYTFALDAALNGKATSATGNKITHELFKVTADGQKTLVKQTEESSQLEYYTTDKPLEGATFIMTKDGKVTTATSDKNGYLSFTGLDAGTYTLQEIEAPQGYTVDNTTHTVVITAKYNTDGTLQKYAIMIDGTNTSTYEATYTSQNGQPVITEIKDEQAATFISNTKMPSLPSTGGMGTYLFTIGGIALMTVAAAMFIMSRKSKEKVTK